MLSLAANSLNLVQVNRVSIFFNLSMSHLLPECFPFDQIFFTLRYHWACNFNAGKRKHLGGSRDLTAVHTPFILLFKTRESCGDRQDSFNDLIEFQLKIFIANSCSSCLTSAESWGIEENVEILWLTGIFSSRDEWQCILFSLSLGSCFSLYPPRMHNKQTRRREPKIDTFTTFVRNDFFSSLLFATCLEAISIFFSTSLHICALL